MKTIKQYIINENTVCIKGIIDQFNRNYSQVIEGEQTFIVNMSPLEIIDKSLHYFCSSLQGAIEASRSIFGNICMLPLVIYAPLDLYWFPCSSPNRPDCIWFSLRNIISCDSVDKRTTIVHTKFGHEIILKMKRDRFERKWQRATHLRYIFIDRLENAMYMNQDTGINIVSQPEMKYFVPQHIDKDLKQKSFQKICY